MFSAKRASSLIFGVLGVLTLWGCDDKVAWEGELPGEGPPEPLVRREIDTTPTPASLGIPDAVARYVGSTVVKEEIVNANGEMGHVMDPASGPRCIGGGDYKFSSRLGTVNKLHIFLQGGGACWSEVCIRSDGSTTTMPSKVMQILSPMPELNPMAEWHTVYLPYCDGSLFIGDIDYDDDGDGEIDRYHRGLQNISAALDVAIARFGEPDEIVVSGLSAGGYGTIFASLLLRKVFPQIPIRVFNDSGVGVTRGADDPEFLQRLVGEWGAEAMVPETCGTCLEGGHLTSFIHWVLMNDENLRMSAFSYDRDSVIADTFMGVGGDFFQQELFELLPELEAAFPDQYRYAITRGTGHTTLGAIDGTKVQGVPLSSWIQAMLDGSPDWVSLVQDPR